MRRLLALISATLLSLGSLMSGTAMAASASLYLSPASGSIYNGSTTSVGIYENSGAEPVNAASVTVTYPTDKLTYVSTSNSSAFSIVAAQSGGNGTVRIDRGALPAVTGAKLIATVRFKGKVSSGTATLGLSGTVLSANSNANIASGAKGGSYTLAAAPPAAAAPVKDTIAPTLTAVKVTNITATSATVNWTTSEPANSQVDYGPGKSYGLTAVDAAFVTDHKVVLNSPLIEPAVEYHFMAKSSDSAGNPVSSADGTFTTKGLQLKATVVDQNNKAVSGASISIGGNPGVITDKQGVALASNLKVGQQTGIITYKGSKTSITVTMQPADPSGKIQTATFKIKKPASSLLVYAIPLVLILGLVWLFGTSRGRNFWHKLTNRGDDPGPGSPPSSYISSTIPPTPTNSGPTVVNPGDNPPPIT